MAIVNGIITSPVPIPSEVNQILGTSHTDTSYFCTDPGLNKWSKYKPLIRNKIFTTDEFDFTNGGWLTSATWWKGNAKGGLRQLPYTCGLNITAYEERADFKSAVDNNNAGWDYVKPTGGAAAPYRITDFSYYNHQAPALFEGFSCPDTVSVNGSFSITMRANIINNNRYLKVNDFFPNSASNKVWFFGVICYSGTTKLGECNSKIPIGQDAETDGTNVYSWGEIKLKAPSSAGTYKLYPCVFYASNFDNNPTGDITSTREPIVQSYVPLPLPGFGPKTITVSSSGGGGGGGGTTSQQLSYYAVFYVAYQNENSYDIDNSYLMVSCTTTAGSAVPSTTRTNTTKMYLGSIQYSGFTPQTDTFTYSGTSNNPHEHTDTLTYTAFGSGLASEKRRNMGQAIEQAMNGNAFIQINDENKVAINVRRIN